MSPVRPLSIGVSPRNLLFGLGNPGRRFAKTRHNAGAMVLGQFARQWGIALGEGRFESLTGYGEVEGKEVLLVSPQGYMNRSGHAVERFVKRHSVPLENIIVICDDINLPLGNIRIRKQGSAGGHNGLASIIEALGSSSFPRLRVGIRGEVRGQTLEDYVLAPFKRGETRPLKESLDLAACALYTWLTAGIERAMSKYNSYC